jgi:hypothetical protein
MFVCEKMWNKQDEIWIHILTMKCSVESSDLTILTECHYLECHDDTSGSTSFGQKSFFSQVFSQIAMNLSLGQQWPVLEVYFNAASEKSCIGQMFVG